MKPTPCKNCQCEYFCCTYKVKLSWWDIIKIKLTGHNNFWERDDNYKIIKQVNNYCYFLNKNKKCKIHKIRPKPCRTFPFLYPEIKNCQDFYKPWKKHQKLLQSSKKYQ